MKREQLVDDARQFPADTSLLDMLARLTPAERLRLHDRALNAALELREAVRRAQAPR
jgi:hypothetical protein